ncbi:MAG: Rpn family recombination-promoting nuclease/putative transposase [Thermosynechococcaceae cyanobacterium]
MIEHDQLFKELVTTFFVDFIDLFFPKTAVAIDPKAIEFLSLEQEGGTEQDGNTILVKTRLRMREACFWISIESQTDQEMAFNRRIFHKYAQLDAAYDFPIYPIILFPTDPPQRPEPNYYRVEFVDRKVLDFNFVTLQMSRLNWRDFLKRRNPVAAALMTIMNVQVSDKPVVKAECLRLLATLKLDTTRLNVVSRFIDTYLKLDASEEQIFKREVERMGLLEREQVMDLLGGSGKQKQTLEKGAKQEALKFVLRLLNRRVEGLNAELEAEVSSLPVDQIEDLGEALLDFSGESDLVKWLKEHKS